MEEPQLKCCRTISSFSSLFWKSHKLVDRIFFIVRVQFSAIRHKKSSTETVPHSFKSRRPRSDVLEEVQGERGIQRIHRPQRASTTRWWSRQQHLKICVLQAQRTCLHLNGQETCCSIFEALRFLRSQVIMT